MTDLDLYVGVSGGAFVSALLASGFSPREMYDEVTSRSPEPFGVATAPLFRVGAAEFLKRSLKAPRVLGSAARLALSGNGRNWSDLAFSLFELLPPGLLDTSGIQEYLTGLLRARGREDRFDDLPRPLYVVAVDLDSGEAVAFGDEDHRDVPVSRAVQASTAIPGLYRPVRIDGRDFVDGGVKKTAHINLAIQKGAGLVICINPLVPIRNPTGGGPLGGHLSNRGVTYVLDQVMRIALHGRMEYGLERYAAEHPEVDILLLEPPRDDLRMFSYNIMRRAARQVVAEHAYQSVLRDFRENAPRYRRMLKKAGIALRDPFKVPDRPARGPYRSPVARSLAASLERAEARLAKRAVSTRAGSRRRPPAPRSR
jgi:predicted acylesterase/phospholipase RssA